MSSYVLDKDLLQSARLTTTTSQSVNWIDVNSNTALLGTTHYYRSSDSELKKQIADVNKSLIFFYMFFFSFLSIDFLIFKYKQKQKLQDQMKMLKIDAEKKDNLISELSSFK